MVDIPKGDAILCGDCGGGHNQADGSCPGCTSEQGVNLSQLLDNRDARRRQRDIAPSPLN